MALLIRTEFAFQVHSHPLCSKQHNLVIRCQKNIAVYSQEGRKKMKLDTSSTQQELNNLQVVTSVFSVS